MPLLASMAALLFCRSGGAAEPVSIWYRSADGCPSADAFLGRLASHHVTGRVARAGDHIDFVVTLGQDQGEASGALERQSARGTVAIRELRAPSCDAVADALVLTLALTLGPDSAREPTAPPPPSDATSAPAPAEPEAPIRTEPELGAPRVSSAPVAPTPAPRTPKSTVRSRVRASVGADGSVASLLGASAALGVNAFAEARYERGVRPAARVSLGASFASEVVPHVDVRLLFARVEGCPFSVGGTLRLAFCAALDLGAVRAVNSGSGDTADAFWSAIWAISRIEYALSGKGLGLELGGGLSTPLTRYRVRAEQPRRTVAEVRPIAVGLSAGASFRWP